MRRRSSSQRVFVSTNERVIRAHFAGLHATSATARFFLREAP
jgi:hypothetical protein